jgi:hypothetical protein
MTEPGNELAAGVGGQGRLRASRADREQVVDMLKTAFAQGRLDRHEFDSRVARALVSRTYADLTALTTGIPARSARARPPEPAREPPDPARESVSKAAVVATASATAALFGMLPVMMLTPPWPSFVLPVALVWFVLAMAVPTGWVVLLHAWIVKRAGRQSAQGLPPGSGGTASQRPQVPGMRPPRRGSPLGRGHALGCSCH